MVGEIKNRITVATAVVIINVFVSVMKRGSAKDT